MSEKCAIVLVYVSLLAYSLIVGFLDFQVIYWVADNVPSWGFPVFVSLTFVTGLVGAFGTDWIKRVIRREYCVERALNALHEYNTAVDDGRDINRTEIFLCEIDCRQNNLQKLSQALRDKLK